jgi:hypothetical protein
MRCVDELRCGPELREASDGSFEALAFLRQTVERYLDESFGGHKVAETGDFLVWHGSTVALAQPAEGWKDRTAVVLGDFSNGDSSTWPSLWLNESAASPCGRSGGTDRG